LKKNEVVIFLQTLNLHSKIKNKTKKHLTLRNMKTKKKSGNKREKKNFTSNAARICKRALQG
jgi:hypothetical protein